MHHAVAAGLGLAAVLFTGPAQDQHQESFVIEAGQHALTDLILESGEFLGFTYLIDRAQCPDPGTTMLQVPRRLEVPRRDVEAALSQILFSRGWVRVLLAPEEHLYEWIWLQGPKAKQLKRHVRKLSPQQIRERQDLVEYVLTTVDLEYTNAQLASANLRQFFSDSRGYGQLLPLPAGGTLGAGGSLLLTGFRPAVAAMLDVLREIDEPPSEPAPSVEERLQELERRLRSLEQQENTTEKGKNK